MLERLERSGELVALTYQDERAHYVFGTRHFPRRELEAFFPTYRFCHLKQVHGRAVVPANPEQTLEADGHFTSRAGWAVVAQTADCVPILLASDRQVCALHAGWRGVQQNIVSVSGGVFAGKPPQTAVIGPHIRRKSFEVGVEVARELLQAAPAGFDESRLVFAHPQPEKRYFDLATLVRAQLEQTFPGIRIIECAEDTCSDPTFHSFRRDREKAERQYSFVVLKP